MLELGIPFLPHSLVH